MFATHGAAAQAVEILERVRKTAGPSYELAFNLAGAYLLRNDPARALEQYNAALALKPDSGPALRQAAAVAEQRGVRAIALVLDACEEGRSRESGDSSGLRPVTTCGWICWTTRSPRS